MYVRANRNTCKAQAPDCEKCFLAFLRNPHGKSLNCFETMADDGDANVTFEFQVGDAEVVFSMDEDECQRVANSIRNDRYNRFLNQH